MNQTANSLPHFPILPLSPKRKIRERKKQHPPASSVRWSDRGRGPHSPNHVGARLRFQRPCRDAIRYDMRRPVCLPWMPPSTMTTMSLYSMDMSRQSNSKKERKNSRSFDKKEKNQPLPSSRLLPCLHDPWHWQVSKGTAYPDPPFFSSSPPNQKILSSPSNVEPPSNIRTTTASPLPLGPPPARRPGQQPASAEQTSWQLALAPPTT